MYNKVDKWSRIVLSLAGIATFSAIMLSGFNYGWPVGLVGIIGMFGFGRMLSKVLEKNNG